MSINFKKTVGDWQVLYDNLTSHLTDMPQLTGDHTALGAVLGRARDLQNQQEAATGLARDLNQQRRELLKEGGGSADRLASGLRIALGKTSEKLIQFGVKPRPRSIERPRLTPAEKAVRAAQRAAAKAAALTGKPQQDPTGKPAGAA
jgi:hypothetical protein